MAHYKHVLTVHSEAGKINIVSFSPTKRLLASGSSGGLVQLWDLKSRGSTKELKLRSAVLSLAWDSSSDRLFVGCKNGTILSLDPSAQRGLNVIRVADRNVGHGAGRTFPVDGLAINREGQLAHTAGRHVLFYNLNGHQFPVGIKALPAPIDLDHDHFDSQAWTRAQSLHYIDDNKLAVCYEKLNCIITWDLTNQQMIWRSRPIFGMFAFSSIGQKGDRIIVPDAHSGVHVIPLSENKSSFLLRYYPDPSTHAINFGAAFASNDVLVASGHRGRIVIWNVCKRKIIQILSHPDHWFYAFAAKDDDGVSFIAAATGDTGEIMVFATPYTFRQRKLAPTDGKITANFFLAIIVIISCIAVVMACFTKPSSFVKKDLIVDATSFLSSRKNVTIFMHGELVLCFSRVNRWLRILVWRWLDPPDALIPLDMVFDN